MARTTSIGGGGSEDRVMATAQQIVNSLNNTPKEVREDMLLILSSFDNRLSNISSLIGGGEEASSKTEEDRFDEAEKIILELESRTEANEYLEAVDDMLRFIDDLSIQGNPEAMDRAESAVQLAITRLEDEFRHILIRNTVPLDAESLHGSIRRVSISYGLNDGEIYESLNSFAEGDNGSLHYHERGDSLGDNVNDCVDLINPDAVMELKEIADRMIRSGYEKECCQVYSSVRRDALDECLVILGVEKMSIEEVQKIEWKDLDEKMKKWIQAMKISAGVLLSGEKRLCDQIFSGSDSTREICFNETTKGGIMQLLNFGEAVTVVKRSSEKLFRILDMYDALARFIPDLEEMITDEFVISEAQGVLAGLGEAATGTFAEFENAVKGEASRKPMMGGEIHPLTRYVMNYLKLLVDYSHTLNSLLSGDIDELKDLPSDSANKLILEEMSPLARRLFMLLSCLESNLEEKSRLYEDGGMQYIFLMNNILYIVQKVKDSELGTLLGDLWVRKRRGLVRQYATSYLRASWSKVLSCLKDEGIGGSSNNASKVALKERFKNFNACFEELYRVQTGWKVPDPQLREELRISVSEKVIPAYRSFYGRFAHQLESGRHGKYIKYSADDLEDYLLDFFEGSVRDLHYMRRKNA